MPKIKKILKKSYLLIGLFVFIWFIKDIDFNQFKLAISEINPLYFIAATSLYLPIMLLKSYRWKKIMDTQQIHYSPKNAFLMCSAGMLIGLITPGRVGEFSKVIYLKKDNHSIGKGFYGTFLDKLFDLLFITIFGGIIIFFMPMLSFFSINYATIIKWGAIAIIAILSLIAIFYFKNKEKLLKIFFAIVQNLKQFKLKDSLIILFLTAISWFIYFISIYLIAVSIDIHTKTGFLYLAFSSVLVQLAAFLPITTLGIGTREAALIFLLTPLGISKETIILFSLLIMINYFGLFLVCLYGWFKKPLI